MNDNENKKDYSPKPIEDMNVTQDEINDKEIIVE